VLTVWTTSVIQGPEDVYSGGRRTIPQPRNATKYDFDEEPQASELTEFHSIQGRVIKTRC
jgi:hypothetical protein